METNELTGKIIGAAIEVHRQLGPGMLESAYVENKVVVELKAQDIILPVHEAQILTYLRFANIKIGLLINFNVTVLKNGIKRFIL